MSDIVTRLLLKTNDFDANLNKSKQSVNSFQDGISGAAKTAGAGVVKFAGAIGLAMGAGESFMKVIRSSQSTSDEFDNVLNSCKSSVDSFFTSLATGDFSTFNQGISEVISKAYAASAALDQLGNTRMAYNYFGTQTQVKIAEGALLAMDKSLPKDERKQGFDGWKGALNEKKEYSGTMKTDALGALIKTVVEGTVLNANDVTLEDFENITKLDLKNPAVRESEKEKLDKYFSYYKTNMDALEKRKKGGGLPDWAFPNSEGTKERAAHDSILSKEQDKLNEKFKESILYKKILDNWSDEELQNAFNLAGEYNKVNEELAIQERTYNKAYDRFSKEKDVKTVGDKTVPSGSLAYFDAEIAEKNKELINATTAQARAAVKIAIDELEAKKINLKIELDKDVFKSLYGEAKGSELKKAGLPTQGIDTKKINPFKTKSPISKKDIKLNEDYSDSLLGVADAFGTVGSMANQFGENWLAFAFNSMGSIGQMIMQLQSLATAQGVASAFALPFPANLGAIATVVSTVASIFGSLPAFENGGIVPGVSFTGDKVHARVNSGEMILNGGQQANLFRMLNSRIYGGITSDQVRPVMGNVSRYITPDESSREIKVSGTLRANGSVLETVLNNYAHKKSKVR